ncbi:histidine kinase [Mesorhizobium huakuii]|uniref:CBS domain-containing protein n=1 Tax=Mesorhizobium huakuii TaxID=28104 RepID=UPI00235B9AAD|nr:CBS domain-containing protein [Mesorhizobium huakuii]GLQ77288.1 histidine kinase [Mesorhizobium huakuii]
MQASSIMTSPVIAVEPSASIADAAGLMLSRKISGLPVISRDGVLVGIVSEGDFLRRRELGTKRKRPRWLEFLVSPGRVAEEYVHANGRRVDEVMSENVVTTSPETALEDVVELMMRHQVKRIPVVEGGKVVGIVTRSDLLRALLRSLPKGDSTLATDEQIRQKIVAELAAQPWAGTGMIHVRVDKGIAELNGAILDERERQAALVAAENVGGVKSVTDHLFWVEPLSGIVVDPPA